MEKRLTPLISVEEVSALLTNPHVVMIDARGGPDARERFQSGHLRGAIFIDLESQLSSKGPDAQAGGRHPLPDPADFGSVLGHAGITPASHVIVYDDKAGANAAARFWWMMRAIGHGRVQVIDGGLTLMQQKGLPMEQGPSPSLSQAPSYPALKWSMPMADITAVDNARSDRDSLVIDVREGYRYRGESEPIDPVAGHIPGAVNIPYLDNLQADGRFKSSQSLEEKYRQVAGAPKQKKVIVHCGSGVTACHTLLAMAVAGIDDAQLYVGSWSEWCRRDKPVGKGPNP